MRTANQVEFVFPQEFRDDLQGKKEMGLWNNNFNQYFVEYPGGNWRVTKSDSLAIDAVAGGAFHVTHV